MPTNCTLHLASLAQHLCYKGNASTWRQGPRQSAQVHGNGRLSGEQLCCLYAQAEEVFTIAPQEGWASCHMAGHGHVAPCPANEIAACTAGHDSGKTAHMCQQHARHLVWLLLQQALNDSTF